MKFKALTAAVLTILLSNAALFAAVDNKHRKSAKKKQGDRLVSMMPASDAVAVFEARSFLDQGLPRLLSANPALLSHITSHIDMIREKAGIDVRKFDRVALGVSYMEKAGGGTEYEPLVIATATDMNFDALIAAAKASSNGSFRTETISGKSVFIFKVDAKAVANKAAANPKVSGNMDQFMNALSKEIAVTQIDAGTIAIGTLPRVKDALAGRSHLSGDIADLLAANSGGVMTFAMRPPGGMAKFLPLESDELGKTLDSVQFIAGSLDTNASGTAMHVLARTKTPNDALNLRDTLEVGQSLGKIAFGNKKRPDQQVYFRMIDGAKLGMHGSDVTVDITVPQADIDTLVASVK